VANKRPGTQRAAQRAWETSQHHASAGTSGRSRRPREERGEVGREGRVAHAAPCARRDFAPGTDRPRQRAAQHLERHVPPAPTGTRTPAWTTSRSSLRRRARPPGIGRTRCGHVVTGRVPYAPDLHSCPWSTNAACLLATPRNGQALGLTPCGRPLVLTRWPVPRDARSRQRQRSCRRPLLCGLRGAVPIRPRRHAVRRAHPARGAPSPFPGAPGGGHGRTRRRLTGDRPDSRRPQHPSTPCIVPFPTQPHGGLA
jgi:hypothetical protein